MIDRPSSADLDDQRGGQDEQHRRGPEHGDQVGLAGIGEYRQDSSPTVSRTPPVAPAISAAQRNSSFRRFLSPSQRSR